MKPPVRTDNDQPPLPDAEARELCRQTRWYHRFELRPGLVTSGSSTIRPAAACDALGVPADLRGKKALDVGAWDGAITFELERRGAHAVALDVQDPNRVGFAAARKILGSKAVHYQGSVYQLPCAEMSNFDLIVFRGVYYHLKHPILAFERCAMALRVGGTLHVAGAALGNHAADTSGDLVPFDLEPLRDAGVALCTVYPGKRAGGSAWFIPNEACLRAWLEVSGLSVVKLEISGDGSTARLFGSARKEKEFSEVLEHPLY